MPTRPKTRSLPFVAALAVVTCTFAADKPGPNDLQLARSSLYVDVMHAKGEDLRSYNATLTSLIEARRLSDAKGFALNLRRKYESLFTRGVQQVCFRSREELEDYRKGVTNPFEVIYFGYAEVIKMQAYIESEEGQYADALATLRHLEVVAPTAADAQIELGVALIELKRPDEALTAYQRSLSLTNRYAVQHGIRPVALRGLGNAFVELHRLDDAENAYRESLKLDPNNAVATHELKYIQGLR